MNNLNIFLEVLRHNDETYLLAAKVAHMSALIVVKGLGHSDPE